MAPCYWLRSQLSETTARVGGGGGRWYVPREAQRRSVWLCAPAQRGRKRAGGGGGFPGGGFWVAAASAPPRHLKSCTSPICSWTVGARKEAGVGPAGLWMGGACSPKMGARCYPEGAAVEAERRPHPSSLGEGSAAIPLWELSVVSGLRTALGLEEPLPRPRSRQRLHVESPSRLWAGFFCPGLTWCRGVVLQGFEQV